MRYYGQGYEVEVPVTNGDLEGSDIEALRQAFDSLHAQLYGYDQPQEEREIVYTRLAAIGQVSKPEFYREALADEGSSAALKGNRRVYMDGDFVETAIYDRSRLRPNNRLQGPAIVEQFDSTSLIKAGQTARVDEYFNLIVQIKGS